MRKVFTSGFMERSGSMKKRIIKFLLWFYKDVKEMLKDIATYLGDCPKFRNPLQLWDLGHSFRKFF